MLLGFTSGIYKPDKFQWRTEDNEASNLIETKGRLGKLSRILGALIEFFHRLVGVDLYKLETMPNRPPDMKARSYNQDVTLDSPQSYSIDVSLRFECC